MGCVMVAWIWIQDLHVTGENNMKQHVQHVGQHVHNLHLGLLKLASMESKATSTARGTLYKAKVQNENRKMPISANLPCLLSPINLPASIQTISKLLGANTGSARTDHLLSEAAMNPTTFTSFTEDECSRCPDASRLQLRVWWITLNMSISMHFQSVSPPGFNMGAFTKSRRSSCGFVWK